MNSETYKKIHEAQIQRLKDECEKRVSTGIIVAERYNPEWIEDCDKFIAHRCRSMAQKGFVQVLDEAVHQMAADYFNDELHGKWKGMKFEGLGECKNDVIDDEDEKSVSEIDEMELLKTEIAKKNGELSHLRDENASRGSKIIKLETNLKKCQKDLKKAEKAAEEARKAAEKEKKAADSVKKSAKTETKPKFAADPDQYDLFAMAGV